MCSFGKRKKLYREVALQAAKELFYDDTVIDKIKKASSDEEISNIMYRTRLNSEEEYMKSLIVPEEATYIVTVPKAIHKDRLEDIIISFMEYEDGPDLTDFLHNKIGLSHAEIAYFYELTLRKVDF